jgi:acyl-CoA hydrolase
MDRAADLAASRYAGAHFVTASLDALEFRAPVKQGELVEVTAKVVYTSRHTCAAKVRVFAVDKTKWDKHPCSQGIFFMVALSQEGRPLPIMELVPDGPEARKDWEEARDIHKRMIARMRGSMNSSPL